MQFGCSVVELEKLWSGRWAKLVRHSRLHFEFIIAVNWVSKAAAVG